MNKLTMKVLYKIAGFGGKAEIIATLIMRKNYWNDQFKNIIGGYI